jgi:hypothetical protein
VELGRPAGVAFKRADVEMYALSGVFRLLSMAVALLASSDVAGGCKRLRDALLGRKGVVPDETLSVVCDAMVMEAWAIKTLLEMMEQRKTVGEKVPEKLKNGASW